jgi:hypothetical protein
MLDGAGGGSKATSLVALEGVVHCTMDVFLVGRLDSGLKLMVVCSVGGRDWLLGKVLIARILV